ncbi:hypothetical protein, variant [Aphanomyces invadans]|nr:hypothetical protein, variant [Aphanomyces invadans]ETV90903.1 hypothetical protein, variant [Aphanomyces invadans]|eukprot:XP_008880468.1 hypothetical protein, variant [Aphanomyces invadans]
MTGNILQAMATGIERSILVLVFVTRRYMAKVNGSNPNDNCQLEFGMAKCTQTASHMVPVILDPTMKSVATWAGQLKMVLGNLLYVDLSADTADGFEQGCASLLQRVQTLLGRTHVTSSKAGDTYPAQLATEQLADVDEVAPTPVPTDRVAAPVTSMYSFPWLLAWSEAMAGTDNEEVQEDSLVVVLEQLDATLASPQVDSFIQSFPYTTLITAMESPALAEVATQVCAILVDHPRAAASLAALPSFVPTLTSLLQANASATADAALVALTNITFAPPPDRAFTDALVPLLMQLPSRDHVVDVLVNVSAANRSSFLPYLDQLIAMLPSNDKLSPMWKIFLNLSVDAACTASLAALGFVDIVWTTQLHTQDCELTLKLLLGLCRHGAGSSAVAMSSHWQVWLLETGRPSLTIASHLADQDSSDYLAPRANAWTSFWVDALLQHDDDERNVELALCSLVNVAAKDEIWRREIEVHVERAVWPWIIRRSRLQPMALKLVGNLIDMKLVRDLLTAKLQDGMAIDEGDEYARDLWHEIVATLA